METIYNLIMSNIYLYICIIICFLIFETILLIVIANQKKRNKIKNDYVEAEKIDSEINKIETEKLPNELETILQKMQEDINIKPEDVVKKFEEEQEEKAIISYQELVNNVKTGKIEVIDDEEQNVNFVENLPLISNESLPQEFDINEIDGESAVTPQMVKEAIENIKNDSIKEEVKQFKQSEFISPVYGRIDTNIEYPTIKKMNSLDIMNTKDYNSLSEEIKKQEDFLNALKEFRNNL